MNWRVRFRNKTWVVSLMSQIMIVIQIVLQGLNAYGVTNFNLTEEFQAWVLAVVNAVFVVLATLGVATDPTTKGYEDSERAKLYKEPN